MVYLVLRGGSGLILGRRKFHRHHPAGNHEPDESWQRDARGCRETFPPQSRAWRRHNPAREAMITNSSRQETTMSTPGLAEKKIADFLHTLTTTGGLRLKSKILACN